MGRYVQQSLALILLTLVASVLNAPTINSFDKVATLYEGTTVNEVLSTIDCSDPDGDPTTASIKSVTPLSTCRNCFAMLDCLPNECLEYRAGVGVLSHTITPSYLITIICEDGKETPAMEVIEVKIRPNSPPYFQPDVSTVDRKINAASSPAGTVIYDVDAVDDDGDDVKYKLSVSPASSAGNYRIDAITGEITSTIDLRSECRHDVTFSVTIEDGKNTVGPQVIHTVFRNANTAPRASNLDQVVQVPEDTTGTAFEMKFVDSDKDRVTYTVSGSNLAGQSQFRIDGRSPSIDIPTGTHLDYEQPHLRQADLLVTATDGYCQSPPYRLSLQVTDVNEKPQITPVHSNLETCEGKGEFYPLLQVTDEDQPDTFTWGLDQKSLTNGSFSINPSTGALVSLMDYDVDKNAMPAIQRFLVTATDKGGLNATATVTVTFLDCNDNAPMFVHGGYGFSASECGSAGTVIDSINATDRDSAREGNNDITYIGSGGAVSVGSGGDIILNTAMPAGTVVTFDVHATDHGKTPGPLRSVRPAVVSVRFTPCPTTPPPNTTTSTTTTTTTASTTTTTTTFKTLLYKDDDENLPWIIIAALMGTLLLGLLSFMLWRYGHLIMEALRAINCKGCCRSRPPNAKRMEDYRRSPMDRSPSTPSSGPKQTEPPGPGFLFGFWKERYDNEDLTTIPDRATLPAPELTGGATP